MVKNSVPWFLARFSRIFWLAWTAGNPPISSLYSQQISLPDCKLVKKNSGSSIKHSAKSRCACVKKKRCFLENNFWFATTVYLNKCLNQIKLSNLLYKCAPTSVVSSDIDVMGKKSQLEQIVQIVVYMKILYIIYNGFYRRRMLWILLIDIRERT